MPNSTPSPASGGQNTKNSKPEAARWDVLTITSAWFLTNEGTPVLVDGSLPCGASDEQWRELIMRTGVQMKAETREAHWGQYRRCAFLNWCETNVEEGKRPRFFASRNEAEISKDFVESNPVTKSFEISEGA